MNTNYVRNRSANVRKHKNINLYLAQLIQNIFFEENDQNYRSFIVLQLPPYDS